MGRPPPTPKGRPIRVSVPGDDGSTVQRAFDAMHERVKDLEQFVRTLTTGSL